VSPVPASPYRPVLPAVLPSAGAPLVAVELERALVRRIASWTWPDVLLGALALLILAAFGEYGSWVSLGILAVMIFIRSEASVTVGGDEFAIVGHQVVVNRAAEVPSTERLTPPRIMARTFAIVWSPAPLPTTDGRAFELRLRLGLRVAQELGVARRASVQLLRWQRDASLLAVDLRRQLVGPIGALLLRQAPEALDPDALTIDLRDTLPARLAEWGLSLDDVEVLALARVAPSLDACDRVRVTDRHRR